MDQFYWAWKIGNEDIPELEGTVLPFLPSVGMHIGLPTKQKRFKVNYIGCLPKEKIIRIDLVEV